MEKIYLILAYFLKYIGIAGVLFLIIALGVSNSVGGGSNETLILIGYIIVSLVVFFLGNVWSKKLLRR